MILFSGITTILGNVAGLVLAHTIWEAPLIFKCLMLVGVGIGITMCFAHFIRKSVVKLRK